MSVPQHFSIVVLDVEASGALSGPEKKQVREDLYAIVRVALEHAGIAADAVRSEDRGDGIFLLVSADVSKRLLVDPFLDVIDEALRDRRVGDPALRLRLVINHGEVLLDDHGSSGPALDLAFAMVDAEQVRTALKQARGGRLAVVVPDDLYRSLVRGYPRPAPEAFRKRRLETKRGPVRSAWLTVLGAAEQPGSGPRKPDRKPDSRSAPTLTVERGPETYRVRNNIGPVGGTHSGTISFGGVSQQDGDR
jgi:hypothetical protein